MGSLAGDGSVTLTAGSTLTLGTNNLTTQFGGVLSGTGNLVKTGTGLWLLTGSNTYSGATAIDEGMIERAMSQVELR
jgi:autotransporter-associated beta strand protein